MTCEYCGADIAPLGMAAHHRGRPCEAGSVAQQMRESGRSPIHHAQARALETRDLAEYCGLEVRYSSYHPGNIGRAGRFCRQWWVWDWASMIIQSGDGDWDWIEEQLDPTSMSLRWSDGWWTRRAEQQLASALAYHETATRDFQARIEGLEQQLAEAQGVLRRAGLMPLAQSERHSRSEWIEAEAQMQITARFSRLELD